MTTDSRAPRTAAGRDLLAAWEDEPDRRAIIRYILAIEAEAAADPVAGLQDELMEAMDRIAKSKVTVPGEYQQGWIDALKAMADELAASAPVDPVAGEARAVVREIRGRLFEAAWRRDDREWLDPKAVGRILDEVEAALPTPAPEEGEGDELAMTSQQEQPPRTLIHEQHPGKHTDYACGFSGPHCWGCGEPWPCRANRGIAAATPSPSSGLDVERLGRAFHALASHGGPLTPCGYVNHEGEYVKVGYNEQAPEDEYACLCSAIARGILDEYACLQEPER